jgi:RNA-directed DNA polymerase
MTRNFELRHPTSIVRTNVHPRCRRNLQRASYGFRPRRSAHQALRELFGVITRHRQYWVIEVDIRKYFDRVPHQELRAILDQRVTDCVIAG